MSIITLTTDFGTDDHYVAAMKGVILGINPRATIVDITHAIPPQDVRAGAFALAGAAPYFPPGTVHVAVVDPGVGSERRPIALRSLTGLGRVEPGLAQLEQFFVGPDNGVLSLACGPGMGRGGAGTHAGLAGAAAARRGERGTPDEPQILAGRTSATRFTGATSSRRWRPISRRRVCAQQALLAELGEPLAGPPVQLHLPPVVERDNTLTGTIIHIDRFGNCISNILEWRVADRRAVARIEFKGKQIAGIRRTYAEAERGELLALVGSSGYVEIAMRDDSAAADVGAVVGDTFSIEWSSLNR